MSHPVTYKLLPKLSSLIKIRYSIPLTELVSSFSINKYDKNLNKEEQLQGVQTIPVSVYLYNSNLYQIQLVIKFKLSSELESILKHVAEKNNGSG